VISRLTAAIIRDDPEVYASSYGPFKDKFGLYIGTYSRSPSGFPRPRDLITSDPVYTSPEEAQQAATAIIESIKRGWDGDDADAEAKAGKP
jgi:hypothetical protein